MFRPKLKLSWLYPRAYTKLLRKKSTNTIEIAYTMYDNGADTAKPPLMILHAMLGARMQWDHLAKAIQETTGRKVVTVDARNHGDSPRATEHSYINMADDALDLVQKLGMQKVKEDLPLIKEYFPSAELVYIEGANHWVHVDRPDQFLETLCKFLEENE
ncbi:unnamed protein product [Leptidea sinapis]|uniref:sn-1-specific diacylglycerol lipase ABHD11 n=1 Tax=Leptidea sinapis TaxID=189913 RepID=A0A5E4PLF8_9NEOP|nr:unnamed protein product [Leptidea sinapis]